jgi:hypothetical protein
MTYEELLADIESKNYRESRTLDTPYAALRAVMELHKPNALSTIEFCLECSGEDFIQIPCPTLVAIEKELA